MTEQLSAWDIIKVLCLLLMQLMSKLPSLLTLGSPSKFFVYGARQNFAI